MHGHSVLVGGNSVGKSTICEALDLLLGPERLSRHSPVDEHDFHRRKYLDENGNPDPILLEAVLTDLPPELLRKYRSHCEFWNTKTCLLLTEGSEPEEVDDPFVLPALRIAFEGIYDLEEDEFKAECFFASPPPETHELRQKVSRADKRRFGFIYLRALRTGARALSLERGSLLDIIIRLKEDDRTAMWEQSLRSLENLDPPIHDIDQLKTILDEVQQRVRRFVGLSKNKPPFGLYPSALTRESLRRSITLFGASEHSDTYVPYWRLGSGVISAMVFSLLTFIAQLKKNVVFAMEEPELAIPPHTQRRIVQFLQKSMSQSIITTHSPFVLEQFEPRNIVVLRREEGCRITGHRLKITGIKAKTYRGGLRQHFAEAILGRGVICVEGISDREVLQNASQIIEFQSVPGSDYTPLDLSGVTVIRCEGEGGLIRHGQFFKNLGLKTYVFFDKQKDSNNAREISQYFDRAWELKHKGIEKLLVNEIPVAVLKKFISEKIEQDDYPIGGKFKFNGDEDADGIRKVSLAVLKARKGAGYAGRLIEMSRSGDLPKVIFEALNEISKDLPRWFPDVESSRTDQQAESES